MTPVAKLLARLQGMANADNAAGMARFGIVAERVLGVSVRDLRILARAVGRNHGVAQELWASGIFEARILAGFIAEPAEVTRRQADAWAKNFSCWADCDGLCIHLFRKTSFAHELAHAWSRRCEELIKRAGFTMMATLAVHDKAADEQVFRDYLIRVEEEAADERHNVKKGVNWALRQIGKRSPELNREAIRVAGRIRQRDSRAARWIASDALRELNNWKPKGKRDAKG